MCVSYRLVRRFTAAPLCVAALTALAGVALTPGSARAQVSLPMYFDATPFDGIHGPFNGSGTFTFTTDPGDGTFTAADLGTITYSFTVGGGSFTEADQDVDSAHLLFVLSTTPTGRRLQFSDDGTAFGPITGGSLEVYNPSQGFIGFEPSFFGAGLNLYAGLTPNFNGLGDYYVGTLPADVPEPGAVAFGILAASGMLGLIARRRKG